VIAYFIGGGLGDQLMCYPAYEEIKRLHPKEEIIISRKPAHFRTTKDELYKMYNKYGIKIFDWRDTKALKHLQTLKTPEQELSLTHYSTIIFEKVIPLTVALELDAKHYYSLLAHAWDDPNMPTLQEGENEIDFNVRYITNQPQVETWELPHIHKWPGLKGGVQIPQRYDVVIASDSSNEPAGKDYPHWAEVAKRLISEGLTVASVGYNGHAYLPDTDDMTWMSLESTMALINEATIYVGNDSGLYHYANAKNIANIVVYMLKEHMDLTFPKNWYKRAIQIYRPSIGDVTSTIINYRNKLMKGM
jgi:hypothetical protein